MIPLRLRLSGFLSYQDEQVIDFSSSTIWVLAGGNGSGKSSVFDALTYALFGHHRGGASNHGELINKYAASSLVEFDFQLGEEVYRAKRTMKRGADGSLSGSTQQLSRRTAGERFDPIEGTGNKSGFTAWVAENVGLNYETFTSSVLLLQGQAEKLLDSQPKHRAELLGQLVDLERYRKLHDRANDAKNKLKNRLEAVSLTRNNIPEVGELEVYLAGEAVQTAQSSAAESQEKVESARRVERESALYQNALARLKVARARLESHEAVLGNAAQIEKQFARLSELERVLPVARTIIEFRTKQLESEEAAGKYLAQKAEAETRKKSADHAGTVARRKRDDTVKLLRAAEVELQETNDKLLTANRLQERVVQFEKQQRAAADLEAQLAESADPGERLESTRAEIERLDQLARNSAPLNAIDAERYALKQAEAKLAEDEAKFDATTAGGKKLAAEVAALELKLREAQAEQSEAQAALATSELLAEQAEASLREVSKLGGQSSCRTCGQTLTAAQVTKEKKAREARHAEAHAALDEAKARATKAVKAAKKAQADLSALTGQRDEMRTQYGELRSAVASGRQLVEQTVARLRLSLAQLDGPFQERVAYDPELGWGATTYPTRDVLATMLREVNGLKGAKAEHDKLQRAARDRQAASMQLKAARATLDEMRAKLDGLDPAEIQRNYLDLTQHKATLGPQITGYKQALEMQEREVSKQSEALQDAMQVITSLQHRLTTEDERRAGLKAREADAARNLPAAWVGALAAAGMSEHSRWQGELNDLIRAQVRESHAKLAEARTGLEPLQREAELQQAELDRFPDEVRLEVAVANSLAVAAQEYARRAEHELASKRQELATLEKHRADRARLGGETMKLEQDYARHTQLVELLGRNHLQRYLVRQAERQIVEYANNVLDRLSGGQLYLKPVKADEGALDKALDLECHNRATGSTPIGVAFLSGSQKFRVAVSLALAIGQYASRQHRPLESVIIDEGFGCLDRNGRQTMIQELQNLKGQLRCILLVSHQEEFAEAFADGYRCELHDGATRVTRFQR